MNNCSYVHITTYFFYVNTLFAFFVVARTAYAWVANNQPATLSEYVIRLADFEHLFEEQSDELRRNRRVYEDGA